MAQKGVEEQPSVTALFTALRRALAYFEYGHEPFGADNLAVCFLPAPYRFFMRFEKIRKNAKVKLAEAFPGMNEYIIARTSFLDSLFTQALNDRTPQIVLLGAGYDSRPYRFSRLNRSSQIFELDIAPTQNRKISCLKTAKVEVPPQVKFVPINFNRDSMPEVLEKAGYRSDQKTLFIWEGVSYYLERPSVNATLAFISRASKGSLVGFDYAICLTEENQDEYYGAKEFSQSMQAYHKGEKIMFSLAEGQIGEHLAENGLKLVNHMNEKEIEKSYLLDVKGSTIGQVAGYFRFVTATPHG